MIFGLKPLSEARILIVDDEEMITEVLTIILDQFFDVEILNNSAEAIELCKSNPPDLILMDVNMPGIGGLEICRKLREVPSLQHIPIVFMTSTVDIDSQNACWEAGGSDFIGKPVAPSTLIHRLRNHITNKLRFEQLQRLTYKDNLTGLFNRHYLNETIDKVLGAAKRDRTPLSMLMIDADYFKRFNDIYGHLAGDECLKHIADSIKESIRRPQDIAIRYGGEEFLIILPNTDEQGAQCVATDLARNIRAKQIEHSQNPAKVVTLSIGGATCDDVSDVGVNQFIKLADDNLYSAKHKGRNQHVISSISKPAETPVL
ncbi:diguanylate cyclase [Pseudoalteromonas sp. SSDWG2]|uniref:GGDEF domain-containing response regulator n=1 Tax=Pseudoalteromonas sp. SSDWG2 TaxID=3139391 RepID=UPI003BAADF35